MAICFSSRRPRILAVALLCMAPASGHAGPAARAPVYLSGIKQDGATSEAATAAVKERLQQMGESVLPLPSAATAADCDAGACVLQRVRASTEPADGSVLGGQLRTDDRGGIRGQMYWVDVASGKVVTRAWECDAGCEPLDALSRLAGQLVETGPAAAPDMQPGCVARAAPREVVPRTPEEPVRSALAVGVSLSVRAVSGARVSAPGLAAEVQRMLLQMGMPQVVGSSRASTTSAGASLPTLDIELAGGPGKSRRAIVETVALTLAAQGQQRQLRFYCPPEACQANLLPQLRMNLGVLLEDGETAAPSSMVHAALDCPEAPARQSRPIASLRSVPPGPAPLIASGLPRQVMPAQCPGPSRGALIAMSAVGGVLAAGGVASLATGVAMALPSCQFSLDGQLRKLPCSPSIDYTPANSAIGVGVVGIAIGVPLLGYSLHKLAHRPAGCDH